MALIERYVVSRPRLLAQCFSMRCPIGRQSWDVLEFWSLESRARPSANPTTLATRSESLSVIPKSPPKILRSEPIDIKSTCFRLTCSLRLFLDLNSGQSRENKMGWQSMVNLMPSRRICRHSKNVHASNVKSRSISNRFFFQRKWHFLLSRIMVSLLAKLNMASTSFPCNFVAHFKLVRACEGVTPTLVTSTPVFSPP